MSLEDWAARVKAIGVPLEPGAIEEWARSISKRDRRIRAMARLALLPPWPKKPHRVIVPFPWGDREELYKRDVPGDVIKDATEEAPIVKVPLAGLIAIQHSVEPGRVAQYIANPKLMEVGLRHEADDRLVDHPLILGVRGRRIIFDGHHRLTAAFLLEDEEAPCRFVNFDEEAPEWASSASGE